MSYGYGEIYGSYGTFGPYGDYGINWKSIAAVAAAPFTAGGSVAVHAATGGFATAEAKCDRYKLKIKEARRAGKRKKVARLKRQRDKWCAKAEFKEAKREARIERKTARKLAKQGVVADDPMLYDASMDPFASGEDLYAADYAVEEDTGGIPTWLPLALVGAGGLVLAMTLTK